MKITYENYHIYVFINKWCLSFSLLLRLLSSSSTATYFNDKGVFYFRTCWHKISMFDKFSAKNFIGKEIPISQPHPHIALIDSPIELLVSHHLNPHVGFLN